MNCKFQFICQNRQEDTKSSLIVARMAMKDYAFDTKITISILAYHSFTQMFVSVCLNGGVSQAWRFFFFLLCVVRCLFSQYVFQMSPPLLERFNNKPSATSRLSPCISEVDEIKFQLFTSTKAIYNATAVHPTPERRKHNLHNIQRDTCVAAEQAPDYHTAL